jgi:uncharacterized protein (TIGR02271 family)
MEVFIKGTIFVADPLTMEEQKDFREERKEEFTSTVIPVVQEQATVDKKTVESGKVRIEKKVVEVEKTIDIPLLKEGYEIERVPVNKIVDSHPSIREDGDIIIIPVVREVLVVEKRLELVEEVHVIKHRTEVPHTENFTLRKEEVNVERNPSGNDI